MTARKAAAIPTNSPKEREIEMVNVMTSEILAIPAIELRAGDNFGGQGEFFRYSILTRPEIETEEIAIETAIESEKGFLTRVMVNVQVLDISKNVRGWLTFDGEEMQKVQRFSFTAIPAN